MLNGSVQILATASLIGLAVLPLELVWAEQPPSSVSTTSTIRGSAVPNPVGKLAQTPDEHWEELRSGLERLARTYPSNHAYMAELRLSLERVARNINADSN
jgi:hypothetical protein